MALSLSFTDTFQRLDAMGLTDVLLPFLLIFSIVFAVLNKAKLFGKDKKNIDVIVALVIALLVVIPHVTGTYPPGGDVVEIMNNAIPNVSIVIVAIVMLLIMIGVFGVNLDIAGSSLGGIIALLAALIVFFIFGRSAGWFGKNLPPWLGFLNNPDTMALIVVLLVFGIIVAFVTGDDDNRAGEGFMDFFNEIGKSLTRHK